MTITAEQLQNRFPGLLKKLDRRELNALLEALERVELTPSEELYCFGRHADTLSLVWQGALMIALGPPAREVSVGVMGPGRFFGASTIVDPGPALAHVTAVEPTTILRLDHAGLEALRRNHPGAGGKLTRALALALAEWLRTFEGYFAGREKPSDANEFATLFRRMMGLAEA